VKKGERNQTDRQTDRGRGRQWGSRRRPHCPCRERRCVEGCDANEESHQRL